MRQKRLVNTVGPQTTVILYLSVDEEQAAIPLKHSHANQLLGCFAVAAVKISPVNIARGSDPHQQRHHGRSTCLVDGAIGGRIWSRMASQHYPCDTDNPSVLSPGNQEPCGRE